MIDYTNTTALITGGGSGIGKALAEALAARGAAVVLADVNAAGLEAVAAGIGANALPVVVDLAKPEAAAELIERAFTWRGRLDLVCSNAGIGHNKKIKNEPLGPETERLFAVNLFAAVRIAQAYLRVLEPSGARGRLMITGSENSLSAPAAVKGRGLGLYGASKHGVLIAAEWLRDESGDALDVHVLMPGAVYTPLISRGLPDPTKAPPQIGLIMPEQCAALALKGLDLGLFYIPTHAHIADDIRPRYEGVAAALKALGLR
ncbi:SDR family NAD(P)-dependent oxidoreductase [Terricaulis sp.]|uniref:SDR family NAD(P)-dependent oxidoreductase n=1 Tax=Terricaulis sp. TaxID=2768686 RepID=UPI003784F09D